MQVFEAGDFEIERRLESYARARLSPDPQTIARVRARVMREARLQADTPRIAVPTTARPTAGRRPVPGRLALTFLAAAVWLGIAAGAVSAAQAGGLLYPARMWVEQASLPSSAAARATAELQRLDARLNEAIAAAARGDAAAVQAAVAAYRSIANETVEAMSGDADVKALVAAALDRHRVILIDVAARLTASGNTTAASAVEASVARAIVHNQAVIDRVETEGQTTNAGGNSGPAGESDANAGGNGGETGAGAGGVQPTAVVTPKPTKTPKPTPDATAKPTQVTTPNKPSATPRSSPTAKTPPAPAPHSNSDH